jgi:hypothetical protein
VKAVLDKPHAYPDSDDDEDLPEWEVAPLPAHKLPGVELSRGEVVQGMALG